MLGRARARAAPPCGESRSTDANPEGSKRIRFLASRTFSTSRLTSIALNDGGSGGRSDSDGTATPGITGRRLKESNCAAGSCSAIACALKLCSVSARSSSEIGAAPSFRSPVDMLKAWGFVRVTVAPFACGINDESKPVDSSHAFGDTELVLEAVTAFGWLSGKYNRWKYKNTIKFQVVINHSHDCRSSSFTPITWKPLSCASCFASNALRQPPYKKSESWSAHPHCVFLILKSLCKVIVLDMRW